MKEKQRMRKRTQYSLNLRDRRLEEEVEEEGGEVVVARRHPSHRRHQHEGGAGTVEGGAQEGEGVVDGELAK